MAFGTALAAVLIAVLNYILKALETALCCANFYQKSFSSVAFIWRNLLIFSLVIPLGLEPKAYCLEDIPTVRKPFCAKAFQDVFKSCCTDCCTRQSEFLHATQYFKDAPDVFLFYLLRSIVTRFVRRNEHVRIFRAAGA